MQDVYTPAIQGYINLRFVNAVLTDSAVTTTGTTTVDLFSYARNTTVFTKIRPDSVTAFSLLGNNISVADTFYVTRTLATGAPATTPLSGRVVLAKLAIAPLNQRTYTLYYRGDATVSTSKTKTLISYVH